MAHYIDKDALVAEIERIKKEECPIDTYEGRCKLFWFEQFLSFLNTLEVKTDEDNSLEKFKSLQHINGDLRQTSKVWGYAPNLYFFDGMWHVGWFSCEETDVIAIKDFEGNTPEEAIDKAYNWFHSTFCNG